MIDLDDDLKREIAPHLIDFSFVLDDLTRQSDSALHERALTLVARLLSLTLKHLPYTNEPLAVIERLMPFAVGEAGPKRTLTMSCV